MMRNFFTFLVLILFAFPLMAQEPDTRLMTEVGNETVVPLQDVEPQADVDLAVPTEHAAVALKTEMPDTVKKFRPSAWTLIYPLGLHKEATVDTLLYNYQRIALPSMYSDAMATTGNLGGEAMNMIYFQRPGFSPFFFDKSLYMWLPSLESQKCYNVYIPMTQLSYNFGGNKENHTDRLSAQFAGNVNRNIGVGAFVDYLYSKGCYASQSAKDIAYGANVYYTGHRYEMQVLYNAFNFLNKENGGITDDLYITDPAQIQGGDDHVEALSIPVNLTGALTRVTGSRAFTTQTFKLGFWREEVVNDTLTRDVYVPVTKFTYSLDYETRRHRFSNSKGSQGREFFEHTYFNPSLTNDNAYYWHLANTLGIEMVEGFQKWAKFGLSAYATYQFRKYSIWTIMPKKELTEEQESYLAPLPAGIDVLPDYRQSLLYVGGRLQKTRGSILKYAADVRFGLLGEAAGEIEANGDIKTDIRMLGDTVTIEAHGHFSNRAPSFLLKKYLSNHFAWDNQFGKTRRFNVGGRLHIPWTWTTLEANFESVQNMIYFNPESLPTQFGGTVSVFSATLRQELHFGIWNWNNTVTYQASSNQNVLPLPALAVYSNMYLSFRAFKVLTLQIGVDCDYFTRYRGMVYQPATMSFRVQNEEDAISVGNYPLMNAYITAKLYKVRFYVMWSHMNQGWFSKDYFSMPHYPIDPRRFQFGLSIDFNN